MEMTDESICSVPVRRLQDPQANWERLPKQFQNPGNQPCEGIDNWALECVTSFDSSSKNTRTMFKFKSSTVSHMRKRPSPGAWPSAFDADTIPRTLFPTFLPTENSCIVQGTPAQDKIVARTESGVAIFSAAKRSRARGQGPPDKIRTSRIGSRHPDAHPTHDCAENQQVVHQASSSIPQFHVMLQQKLKRQQTLDFNTIQRIIHQEKLPSPIKKQTEAHVRSGARAELQYQWCVSRLRNTHIHNF